MMDYYRLLTVQDISCVGQCSLTVALPILSACGIETCILPSAVLSTHTGGFTGYTFRDLTDDIPAIADHWEKEGIRFDAFYTGYLGSERQIDMVLDIFGRLPRGKATRYVDPAMADNGKLYAGFDADFVTAMKKLARNADVLLPNITEACLLTGTPYFAKATRENISALIDALRRLCPGTIVLTGVGFDEGRTGVMVSDGSKTEYYEHELISQGCRGTGDVFASAYVGCSMRGAAPLQAAKIAADYTVRCIRNTLGDDSHRYGVKFETAIPDLVARLSAVNAVK